MGFLRRNRGHFLRRGCSFYARELEGKLDFTLWGMGELAAREEGEQGEVGRRRVLAYFFSAFTLARVHVHVHVLVPVCVLENPVDIVVVCVSGFLDV